MEDVMRDLEADKAELRTMIEQASRPKVRKELLRVLDKVEADIRHVLVKGTLPPADVAAPADAVAAPAAPAKRELEKPVELDEEDEKALQDLKPKATAPKAAPAKEAEPERKPVAIDHRSAGPWAEITTFALDLGGYDKPLITVDMRLKGIEALPAGNVTCDFTESSFDLKIIGLDGKNHRMLKTNLDKDIVPSESSVKVKKNHVIITLQKVKGSYGFDSWTDLTAKGGKRRDPPGKKKSDSSPQDGMMDMMKDLYDDGDDKMKAIIGEAMYKARKGEKYEPKIGPDGLNELGGMDD